MGHHTEVFVGIDTSKSRNAIAIADGGRGGEVRYLGEFPATEAAIRKLVAKLAAKCCHLTFCYEAGPTGYGLYRLLKSLGHDCLVVACVSAWNKDPVFGVIGIQSGPRDKGPQWLPSSHGSRGWDAGGGDDW
ncbi:hypothetical protein ABIF68_010980 [Bradyrhizobium japonicum]